MKFGRRRAILVGTGLLLFFLAVEVQSYAFGWLSIANGNSFMFYEAGIFNLSDEQLKVENGAGPLGWPRTEVAREQPSQQSSNCGSAFGDSMTHGDEVNDNEAWLQLLSDLLGCNVRNFGVGGYGLDQTALRYERISPSGEFLIVGLFIEMLRRDLAASWTFYQGLQRDNLPHYAITKPMLVMNESGLRLISRPSSPVTNEAVVQHHKEDFYLNTLWTPLSFPYSYAAARAIFRRLVLNTDRFNQSSNQFWEATHASHAAELALKLLARIRETSRQRNQQLVVVMIPQVEETLGLEPAYAAFVQDLARQDPELCVIDTFPTLATSAAKVGMLTLRAPQGHYSVHGNQILADTVRQGLQRCGVVQ